MKCISLQISLWMKNKRLETRCHEWQTSCIASTIRYSRIFWVRRDTDGDVWRVLDNTSDKDVDEIKVTEFLRAVDGGPAIVLELISWRRYKHVFACCKKLSVFLGALLYSPGSLSTASLSFFNFQLSLFSLVHQYPLSAIWLSACMMLY